MSEDCLFGYGVHPSEGFSTEDGRSRQHGSLSESRPNFGVVSATPSEGMWTVPQKKWSTCRYVCEINPSIVMIIYIYMCIITVPTWTLQVSLKEVESWLTRIPTTRHDLFHQPISARGLCGRGLRWADTSSPSISADSKTISLYLTLSSG